MTLAEVYEFLKAAGVTGALIFFIVGGIRIWWVYGWQYTEMKADRDWWKADALRQRQLTEEALRLGETLSHALTKEKIREG